MKFSVGLMMTLGLAACHGAAEAPKGPRTLSGAPEWAYVPEVRVPVTLTPAAVAALRAQHGVIRVTQTLYAMPTRAGEKYAGRWGAILFGARYAETGQDTTLVIPAIRYDRRLLGFAEAGKTTLLGDIAVRVADRKSYPGVFCDGAAASGSLNAAPGLSPVACDVYPTPAGAR